MDGGKFKEFVLEEGQFFDAIKIGLKAGFKAFRKAREQQATADEKKQISDALMNAEGEQLKTLVCKMVDKGYTIQKDRVKKLSNRKSMNDWLYECINTKMESLLERSNAATCQVYIN